MFGLTLLQRLEGALPFKAVLAVGFLALFIIIMVVVMLPTEEEKEEKRRRKEQQRKNKPND